MTSYLCFQLFNRGHSLVKTFLEEMIAEVEKAETVETPETVETLETVEKSKNLKKL